MYCPKACTPSSVGIIALTMLAGSLVAVARERQTSAVSHGSAVSSSATTRPGTCFRPQTSLAMSPSGTLQQVFQFYVPCRDSFEVDENGFLAFPES